MGVLSDFFILNKDSAPIYDAGRDWGNYRYQCKGITPLEAAAILKVIRESPDDRVKLMEEFEFLTPEDADEWILSVPEDMVALMAPVNENKISEWAKECTEITKEELNWRTSDFVDVLTGLSKLSRTAVAESMKMYLWISL